MPRKSTGLFNSAWGEKLKEKIEAKKAKKEIRGKRKEGRQKSRAAVKEIRSKGKPGAARRGLVLATKAFHKVDKEGKKGGYKAFGKFTGSKRAKRIGERVKRQKARQQKREFRKAKRDKGNKDYSGPPDNRVP
jgi:hypothetical protein